ncbi:NAD-dependent epimerase/dehydratase family protein [Dyadobacter luticola]|uniref:NAD(P)-dependent oxidoreductase n=1 Tax=Dyadobacter luticola TaxID=1979387 RepID=A0A5R9L2T6_9BACT|nr:NAD(P)-dependent oxidoreductase [Dyadobacter luticola]TLV02894.1 NAD(P)-dependent oxidoreductase [Dyadobacter luticola]
MDNKSEKILITGITGLVGARLLPRLAAEGWNCHALVRGGKPVPEGINAVEGDILDAETLTEAVKDASAIIHLAAVFRTADTDLIWKSNLEGTQNLIDAAKKYAPNARFILASTAHVYNADNPHPGREDDELNPQLAYPASKLAAENALRASGLNWSVLRFPFVYGDGDKHVEMLPEHVLGKWHPAARMSIIHHRDIANAIKMAFAGKMDGRIVNISDEAPTSVYELLRLVGVTMESSSEPLTNPWHLQVDSSLARNLGFQPEVRTVYQAVAEGLLWKLAVGF